MPKAECHKDDDLRAERYAVSITAVHSTTPQPHEILFACCACLFPHKERVLVVSFFEAVTRYAALF